MNGYLALVRMCSGVTRVDGGSYSSKSIFISRGFSCARAANELSVIKPTTILVFIAKWFERKYGKELNRFLKRGWKVKFELAKYVDGGFLPQRTQGKYPQRARRKTGKIDAA